MVVDFAEPANLLESRQAKRAVEFVSNDQRHRPFLEAAGGAKDPLQKDSRAYFNGSGSIRENSVGIPESGTARPR